MSINRFVLYKWSGHVYCEVRTEFLFQTGFVFKSLVRLAAVALCEAVKCFCSPTSLLTIYAQSLGNEVSQIFAVTFKAVVPGKVFSSFRLTHHDVWFLLQHVQHIIATYFGAEPLFWNLLAAVTWTEFRSCDCNNTTVSHV